MVDDSLKDAIAGGAAGLASSLVVAPLDVVKTRKQAQKAFYSTGGGKNTMVLGGTLSSMRTIFHNEGIAGLYRGVGPMMLGYLPSWSIYFVVYEKCKVLLGVNKKYTSLHEIDSSKVGIKASLESSDKQFYRYWGGQIFSAVIAGAASVTLTNPIWVVKTRLVTQSHPRASSFVDKIAAATTVQFRNLQTDAPSVKWRMPRFWLKRRTNVKSSPSQHPVNPPTGPACSPAYNNTFDAFRKIYKYEGLAAFYRGLFPSLFGTLHVGIQFPLYEYFKSFLDDFFGKKSNFHIVLAATLSKIAASTVTYPHEVLRTRLQSLDAPTHNSATLLIRDIWRSEGWRKYYSGMATNFIRTIPASSVTFLSFEIVRKWLN
ncbi:NAD transporter [Schizosaccharomyces pombe]